MTDTTRDRIAEVAADLDRLAADWRGTRAELARDNAEETTTAPPTVATAAADLEQAIAEVEGRMLGDAWGCLR